MNVGHFPFVMVLRRFKSRFQSRSQRRTRQSYARRTRFTRNRMFRGRRNMRFRLTRGPFMSFNRNRVSTVLRYSSAITLNPNAEGLSTPGNVYVFSGNGCFDPDITGGGHQPMYFDNYAAVYAKYRVKFSKISVTVVNHAVNTATTLGTTPNYSYRLFILSDGTSGATDIPLNMGEIIEEGGRNIKWRFIAPSLNGKLPKLKSSQVPTRLLSVAAMEQNTSALTTSNPAMPTYFYVGVTSADGVTDPPAVSLYVTVKYHVEFFDRIANQNQN